MHFDDAVGRAAPDGREVFSGRGLEFDGVNPFDSGSLAKRFAPVSRLKWADDVLNWQRLLTTNGATGPQRSGLVAISSFTTNPICNACLPGDS